MRILPPGFSFPNHVQMLFVKPITGEREGFMAHAHMGIASEIGELMLAHQHWRDAKRLSLKDETQKAVAEINEELGDMMFYLQAALLHDPTLSFESMNAAIEAMNDSWAGEFTDDEIREAAALIEGDDPESIMSGVIIALSKIIDYYKKWCVYRKEVPAAERAAAFGLAYYGLARYADRIDSRLTIADIQWNNYLKLRTRYPDGYTDAAAIARADKA